MESPEVATRCDATRCELEDGSTIIPIHDLDAMTTRQELEVIGRYSQLSWGLLGMDGRHFYFSDVSFFFLLFFFFYLRRYPDSCHSFFIFLG